MKSAKFSSEIETLRARCFLRPDPAAALRQAFAGNLVHDTPGVDLMVDWSQLDFQCQHIQNRRTHFDADWKHELENNERFVEVAQCVAKDVLAVHVLPWIHPWGQDREIILTVDIDRALKIRVSHHRNKNSEQVLLFLAHVFRDHLNLFDVPSRAVIARERQKAEALYLAQAQFATKVQRLPSQ